MKFNLCYQCQNNFFLYVDIFISLIILLNPFKYYINIILQEMRVTANNIDIRESYSKNENQIYEDLSLFIQIFKKLILNIQMTAINVEKQNQYVSSLEKTKQTLQQLQPILKKYGNQVQSSFVEIVQLIYQHRTFRRLTCRLMEVIIQYKIKYQSMVKSRILSCFLISLKEMEEAIKVNEEGKLLGNIIKIMQISVIKFCMNCEKIRSFAQDKEKPEYSEAYQTMNEKIKRFKQMNQLAKDKQQRERRYSQKIDVGTDNNPDYNNLLSKSPQQKASKNNEILVNIQNQYELYQGMDLDLRLFKTSYIYAKNNQNEVTKDCLQRNYLNGKLITSYHDDFQLFKKRKSKKQNRKNDKKTLKPDRIINQVVKINQQQNKQFTRIRIKKINQIFDPQNMSKSFHKQLLRNKQIKYMSKAEDSKKSCKINNIYFTMNKKRNNINSLIKDSQGSLSPKNKKLANSHLKFIDQTHYNQMNCNSMNSMNFVRSKLKMQYNKKQTAVLRIKTQYDGDSKQNTKDIKEIQQNEKLSQKTEAKWLHNPLKNTKYFEIICTKDKRKEYLRGKQTKGIIQNIQISTLQSSRKINSQNIL